MRRFGDFLLAVGLIVGVGSVVGYELDIIPTLPPELLKLVIYKLAFIGGLGLLVSGALIRRLASKSHGSSSRSALEVGSARSTSPLPEAEQHPPGIPARDDASLEKIRREP